MRWLGSTFLPVLPVSSRMIVDSLAFFRLARMTILAVVLLGPIRRAGSEYGAVLVDDVGINTYTCLNYHAIGIVRSSIVRGLLSHCNQKNYEKRSGSSYLNSGSHSVHDNTPKSTFVYIRCISASSCVQCSLSLPKTSHGNQTNYLLIYIYPVIIWSSRVIASSVYRSYISLNCSIGCDFTTIHC